MRILAIDPGSKESAFVLWVNEHVGPYGYLNNDEMLILIKKGGFDLLAIESIEGFGITAGQEIFDTCWWCGRFCQAFAVGNFKRIGRKEIKSHLCSVTTAKDKDIREALIYRYGEPGKKTAPGKLYGIAGHCWSALAVAVTCADKLKL